MSGSTTGIVVICVVGVLGLVAAIVVTRLAGRRPHYANPQRGQMRGLVQGGQHVGGGRSVAPTRDAPVPAGGGEAPTIEEEVAAHEGRAARGGQPGGEPGSSGSSGSPMDL
jgi:hypothetical protein